MEIKKTDAPFVKLNNQQVDFMWNQLIKSYVSYNKKEKKNLKLENLIDLSTIEFQQITDDLNLRSNKWNSGIKIKVKEKNETDDDNNIKMEYLRNHFYYKNQDKFKKEILNRIVYYIEGNNNYDYLSYFEKNNLPIVYNNETFEMPLAVKNLKGWWLGLNRNLEEGSIAKCHYLFVENDDKMLVRREAYNTETQYNGYVHIQNDSQFVFDLLGRTQNRKKFVMAHPNMINPKSIRCISSGFEIGTGNPIIIKELLFKIKDRELQSLGQGETIYNHNLEENLRAYFTNKEELSRVMQEISDYLNIETVPYISPQDLNLLKKEQLLTIKNAQVNPNTIKKLSVYFKFEKLSAPIQNREIIKYYKIKNSKEETPEKLKIDVKDQYTKIRINQYLMPHKRLHKVYYETDHDNTAVDIQSLFPIVESDPDNDFGRPMHRISKRIMDAYDDTFVSSATVMNDFLQSNSLSVKFEETTQKTEIVIDFTSVQNDATSNFIIDDLTFHYNLPDGKSSEEIQCTIEQNDLRRIEIKSIDKKIGKLEVEQFPTFDPKNPRIFCLLLNFEAKEGDVLYIHFKN